MAVCGLDLMLSMPRFNAGKKISTFKHTCVSMVLNDSSGSPAVTFLNMGEDKQGPRLWSIQLSGFIYKVLFGFLSYAPR